MATVSAADQDNILKLVAGMFNAAPGAGYLKEFSDAFVAMGSDYSALARGLGASSAFKALYPASMSDDAFATQFLSTLGLQLNLEAQTWVKAHVQAGKPYAQVMLEALVALVETKDASFADAQKLLTQKAVVAEYFSVTEAKSSDSLEYLQAVLSKVQTDSDLSTPAAIEALIKAGTADVDPGNPDPGNPDPGEPGNPGNPDPGNPGAEVVNIATEANASTTLSNLAASKVVWLSGKNQTIGSESNAEQRFGTIAIEAPKGEKLQLTLDNTARVDARLLVNLLMLRDDPQDASNLSAVRTLQLVSSGQRESFNYIQAIDAAKVSSFELSGTQKLDISINNAANYQGLPAQVSALKVDGSAMTGALHVWMESPLANAVDLNQNNSFVGGKSAQDGLEFSAGVLTTARTKVSGFETVSFHGGVFDAINTSGVKLYQSNSAQLQLTHLQAAETVEVGSYNAATQTGINHGGAQQFQTDQASSASVLNLTFKSSAAGLQEIATSGFTTLNIRLDTVATQAAAQKQFALDLSKTAVDVQMHPLQPLEADYALVSDVPASHWTKTQLSTVVVTGGSGLVNGAVDDKLDLSTVLLPASVKLLDVSGYQGSTTVAVDWPHVNTIEGVRYSTGNTTIKAGAYGLTGTDMQHMAGVESVTTFEFTADALSNASAAASPFVWNIHQFMGIREAGASVANLTVLDVGALGVHGLQDMQMNQEGADTVITGNAGQNFKIVLTGQTSAELGLENFAFA